MPVTFRAGEPPLRRSPYVLTLGGGQRQFDVLVRGEHRDQIMCLKDVVDIYRPPASRRVCPARAACDLGAIRDNFP